MGAVWEARGSLYQLSITRGHPETLPLFDQFSSFFVVLFHTPLRLHLDLVLVYADQIHLILPMKCLQLLEHLPLDLPAVVLRGGIVGLELLFHPAPVFVLVLLVLADVVLLYLAED